MNRLKELIDLISPGKIRKIRLIDATTSRKTKIMQLYYGIYRNKYQSDEIAIKALYGEEKVGTRYSKLKHDLEQRLLNVLLASDMTNAKMNDRQRAYYKYFKIWSAANILLRMGLINYAIRLLEKTLKHFERNDFTVLALESTRLLRNHYYRHEGDYKKGSYYHELTQHYLQQYNAEVQLAGYMDQIIVNYVKDKGDTSHLQQQIDQYLIEAKKIVPQDMNANIFYRLKMLEVTKYMNAYDYRKTAETCERAIGYFIQEKPDFRTYITIFLNQWIISCTQLKRYDKAKELIRQSFEYLEPGEYNWFKVMEYKTQLAFYMEEYSLAYVTYQTVIQHTGLSQLPDVVQEKWMLYEAYAQFLYSIKRVTLDDAPRKKFRLYKFLNNVQIFTKDKRGLNIPITIIQACFEICTQRFDRMINRMEALDKYRVRYVNERLYLRSNIFIKMLIKLVKADFCPEQVMEKVKNHLRELERYPFNEMTKGHELEIIPYTHLWHLLMEELRAQSGVCRST